MKIRKMYFPVTQRIHTLERRGGQKQRYKEIITFEFENRGLRLTTSSIWGWGDTWWLNLNTVYGVGRSWLGTQKAVLLLKNKPEGISLMSSGTGRKLWFSAASL